MKVPVTKKEKQNERERERESAREREVMSAVAAPCYHLLESLSQEPILSYLLRLTKEGWVICSRWHRGRFPPHAFTHELQTFLVNWVADNEWMMC